MKALNERGIVLVWPHMKKLQPLALLALEHLKKGFPRLEPVPTPDLAGMPQ